MLQDSGTLKDILNAYDININDKQAEEIMTYLRVSADIQQRYELTDENNSIKNNYAPCDQWNKIPIGATVVGPLNWDATQHGSLALLNENHMSKIVDVMYYHMNKHLDKYDVYYCKGENATNIATFIKLMNFAHLSGYLDKKQTIIFMEDVNETLDEFTNEDDKEDFIADLSNLCNISRDKGDHKIAIIMSMPEKYLEEYFTEASVKIIRYDGTYHHQHISKEETLFKFYPSPERYIHITHKRHFKEFEIDRLFNIPA